MPLYHTASCFAIPVPIIQSIKQFLNLENFFETQRKVIYPALQMALFFHRNMQIIVPLCCPKQRESVFGFTT